MTQDTEDVVGRLCKLHEKMLLAVERNKPYSPIIACGNSDLDTVLDAAVTLERAKTDRQSLSDRIDELEAEAVELRAERDSLLQKPIDLAKLDSIDEDASGKMVAYYWWQQAQDARAALHQEGIRP